MLKKYLASLLCVTMTASMIGCAAPAAAPAEAAAAEAAPAEAAAEAAPAEAAPAAADSAVELIFTSVSVTGDSHTTAMTVFADKVKELSGGTVTCKTYSDGTLFSSENEFDAIISGDASLAYISFPTLATQEGLDWCSMFASGYFWSSYDHMTNVLNGDIGKNDIFAKVTEKVNIVPLGALYLGSRVVNTREREINKYEDMAGLLLRMPNSETWLHLGEALGANPTPLSFSELYTALQTGAVDGQENPLPTDVSAKFYEVTKYLAITNHVIDSVIPCINKDIWTSMSDAQREAVQQAMDAAREANDAARIEMEAQNIAFLEGEGLTVTYPDLTEFKAKVQEYYTAHPEQTSVWDMELYNKVQSAA